eukprot:g5728.t1
MDKKNVRLNGTPAEKQSLLMRLELAVSYFKTEIAEIKRGKCDERLQQMLSKPLPPQFADLAQYLQLPPPLNNIESSEKSNSHSYSSSFSSSTQTSSHNGSAFDKPNVCASSSSSQESDINSRRQNGTSLNWKLPSEISTSIHDIWRKLCSREDAKLIFKDQLQKIASDIRNLTIENVDALYSALVSMCTDLIVDSSEEEADVARNLLDYVNELRLASTPRGSTESSPCIVNDGVAEQENSAGKTRKRRKGAAAESTAKRIRRSNRT